MKFKVDDRVRRIKGGTAGGIKVGDVSTIIKIESNRLYLKDYTPSSGTVFVTTYFELAPINWRRDIQ